MSGVEGSARGAAGEGGRGERRPGEERGPEIVSDADLAALEARLRAFTLREAPEGLRARVLSSAGRARRRAAWRVPLALAAGFALAILAGWIDEAGHRSRLEAILSRRTAGSGAAGARVASSSPSPSPIAGAAQGLGLAAGDAAWLARRAEAGAGRRRAIPPERWTRIRKEGRTWRR